MSSKHTPGPWSVGSGSRATGFTVKIASDELLVGGSGLTSEANARLIAAAPELLEALSKAVRETEHFLFEAWLVRVCPSGDVDAVQRQWLESSDHLDFLTEWREQLDVITKATGEPACAS